MKVYEGTVDGNRDWQVFVTRHDADSIQTTEALNPRLDLRNHSPSGLAWGYAGSGPAQLSLALLADALGDDAKAQALYQQFKWLVVGGLPQEEGWVMSDTVVRRLAKICERQREREEKS